MTNRLINILAFCILTLLWLAFAAVLIFDREQLITAWQTLRSWNIVIQIAVWLLTLPVTLGLWIWQTTWPVLVRLILVAGLAVATVYTFFPWKKTSTAEMTQEPATGKSSA